MIASTTLAGPGAEASIGDALRSCAHLVDEHLILAPASSLELLARSMKAADIDPQRLCWRVYEWPGSYGEARNAALSFAEDCGADWALTVDSDERLAIAEPPRQAMSEHWLCLSVVESTGGYAKPRWLRCNAGLRWVGKSCERLLPERDMALVDGTFFELQKTPEQEMERMRRGVRNMPAMLEQEYHPQWLRHYAECLLGTGDQAGAVREYRNLTEHPEANREARSWAHFRLAQLEIQAEAYETARERCGLALSQDPGFIQEFGALLAFIAAKQKRGEDAIMWATYAAEAPVDLRRGGHRGLEWRDICARILGGSAVHMAPSSPPAREVPFPFAGRREAFAGDYAVLASALIQRLLPDTERPSHLDLGAGNGLLVGPMRNFGVMSWGLEASTEAERETDEDAMGVAYVIFGRPLESWAQLGEEAFRLYDLVSCVEVAEHIPAARADELVDACCSRAGRWIYFSAAHPGQGGHGHVNEQPRQYWVDKFAARGWRVDWGATEDLITRIGGMQTCRWLIDNALILTRSGGGAF